MNRKYLTKSLFRIIIVIYNPDNQMIGLTQLTDVRAGTAPTQVFGDAFILCEAGSSTFYKVE